MVSFSLRLIASSLVAPAAIAIGLFPMLELYVRSSHALERGLPLPASLPKSLPSLDDHGEVVLTKVKMMWMPCIGPPQTSITAGTVVSRVPSHTSSTSPLRFLAPSFQGSEGPKHRSEEQTSE